MEPPAYSTTDLPTNYDAPMPRDEGIFDTEFVKSLRGLMKVLETVLSIVVIICASIWDTSAAGWVMFVSITALIITVVVYVLYVFRLPAKMSPKIPFYFVEFMYYDVFSLFYLIAGIVSAVYASDHDPAAASAFFCFAALLVFAVDAYFSFSAWRISGEGPKFGGATSSDTTNVVPATTLEHGPGAAASADKGRPPTY